METAEMPETGHAKGWDRFYERLRSDMIEAQCCLESGRIVRASDLIEKILRAARRAGAHISPESEFNADRRAGHRTARRRSSAGSNSG